MTIPHLVEGTASCVVITPGPVGFGKLIKGRPLGMTAPPPPICDFYLHNTRYHIEL